MQPVLWMCNQWAQYATSAVNVQPVSICNQHCECATTEHSMQPVLLECNQWAHYATNVVNVQPMSTLCNQCCEYYEWAYYATSEHIMQPIQFNAIQLKKHFNYPTRVLWMCNHWAQCATSAVNVQPVSTLCNQLCECATSEHIMQPIQSSFCLFVFKLSHKSAVNVQPVSTLCSQFNSIK